VSIFRRPAPPGNADVTERIGHILQLAEEEAHEMIAAARREADRIVAEARQEADAIRAQAKS